MDLEKLDALEGETLPEGQSVMAIMDATGDTKMIWSRDNQAEIDNARRTFDDLKKKGFTAFAVRGKDGDKGEKLHAFDPQAERLIMVPPMVAG